MTDEILMNGGKIDKYQPRLRGDNNDYISTESDHMDRVKLSPTMTRSNDRDGSIYDSDGKDHDNGSSSFDIEYLQSLKR